MSKIEIPNDILDIIFDYKKQFDLINIVNELKTIKNICPNCEMKKICMYDCRECDERICFECRYADLNDGIVEQNDFELFYKCDKCDIKNYNFGINTYHSEDECYDSDLDYYNDDRYARCWSDCF